MTHQHLVAMEIIAHACTSLTAIAGAIFLAYNGKDGWDG